MFFWLCYGLRHRYGLWITLLACISLLLYGSFFIWDFEIEGNSAISDIEILRALEKHGIIPGKDIALISFDGVQFGKTLTPSLSAIVQPVKEIARTVFDMFETWEPGQHPQRQLYPYFRPGGTLSIKDTPAQEKTYKIINKRDILSVE